jgi:hypothetical protein
MQIYVPVREDNNHWYLFVMAIESQTIYNFDLNLTARVVTKRHDRIRTLATVLIEMMALDNHYPEFINHVEDVGGWDLKCATGIPTNSNGLW